MSAGLGAINWLVIVVYLLGMLGVGLYFTKRASASNDSFFRAGGRIPAWAAGFSIYATTLSAITFMSTPEQAYNTDWSYAAGNLAIFAIVPILIRYYIPFFRKLDVTTAYEYLEERFSPVIRVIGSLLFVIFHIGRIAIVIYLPTLALTSVTDINPLLIVTVVGLLCVVYTFLAGMEGVIWSDVIQGIILLAGAALIIAFGLSMIDGGLATVVSDARENGKFLTASNFKFGTAAAAVQIIFIGSIFNALQQYTASQDVVQRYQTTEAEKDTAQSLIWNGVLALITIPLFYGIGTVLYSYFERSGGLPAGVNTSAIVPYFIVTALPAGVAGLLIAAIFAAAQSTISSSLNSISACVTVDLRERFFASRGPASVGFSRLIIVIAGLISLVAAVYLTLTNKDETWNLFLSVMGLFGVPLAGVFALGIFTRRANALGVIIGLLGAAFFAWYLPKFLETTPFHISMISFIASVTIGYLASLLVAKFGSVDTHDVKALTIYGRADEYTHRIR
ncbi:MAG: sodium:solute symporter [Flaviflexus sp.]|nr:sodium:solute symporter [Flaviflexus sp.]